MINRSRLAPPPLPPVEGKTCALILTLETSSPNCHFCNPRSREQFNDSEKQPPYNLGLKSVK